MHPDIERLMERIPRNFKPQDAAGVDAVFQLVLTGEKSGEFYIAILDKTCRVAAGRAESPSTTFTTTGEDWTRLTEGKTDGTTLFMQGKLKVDGDMGLAMRFSNMFESQK